VQYLCLISQPSAGRGDVPDLRDSIALTGALITSIDPNHEVRLDVVRNGLVFSDPPGGSPNQPDELFILQARDLNHMHRILRSVPLAYESVVRLFPLPNATGAPDPDLPYRQKGAPS